MPATPAPTYTFDGCGINQDGRRILTGARADWDDAAFRAFCLRAISAPMLATMLRTLTVEAVKTLNRERRDGIISINLTEAVTAADALLARLP